MANPNIYYQYGGDGVVKQEDEQNITHQPQHPQPSLIPHSAYPPQLQQPQVQHPTLLQPNPGPFGGTSSQWPLPIPRVQTPSTAPPEIFTQVPLYPQPLVPGPSQQPVQPFDPFLQPPQLWNPAPYHSSPFQADDATPTAQVPPSTIHPQPRPQSTRFRPALSIALPQRHQHPGPSPTKSLISPLPFSPGYSHGSTPQGIPQAAPALESPYLVSAVGSLSVGSRSPPAQEYFPPYIATPSHTPPFVQHRAVSNPNRPTQHSQAQSSLSSPSSKWLSPDYEPSRPPLSANRSASTGSSTKGKEKAKRSSAKTSRQQFTACGACRWRRVKCDLKARQEEAEKLTGSKADGSSIGVARKRVSCTNCLERGTNCV